jgi:hypothetical protein
MRRPHTMPIFYNLLYLASRGRLFLFKAKDLNFIVLVFQDLQFFLMIQQIHALTAVYLKHANIKFNTLLVCSNLKYIIDGVLGDCIDSKGLSRTRLPIGKARYDAILENYR